MPREQAGWVETASADDAEATATRAADSDKQHVIYGIDASFTSTVAKLLELKDGTTVIWSGIVYDSREITFPVGIPLTKGNAANVVLAASGAGANIGYVNMHGRSY